MAINASPRFIRKTIVLAAIETTYGVAPAQVAANALLMSNVEMSYTSNNKNREVIRPYLGASEMLVGDDYITFTFTIEMAPSGIAGTAPQWGKLLRACGMAEVITATSRVEYVPVSTGQESIAISYYIDGMRYLSNGLRGTFEIVLAIGDTPKLKFTFTGRYFGAANDVANANGNYSAWKVPQVITNANTGDIKFGSAYSSGSVTGGEPYASRGLNFSLGNGVSYQSMLGATSADRVLITSREPTGSITLDLDAATEELFRADMRLNVTSSMSFEFGTVAGSKIVIFAPSVQRLNPKIEDQDGVAMTAMDLRFLPVSGNDELRIICK